MVVDFLVIGFGLAGMAISKKLEDKGHSFRVISDDSQKSSKVAAGVFNPVILKRFTPVWNAQEQLENLFPFYEELSKKFGKTYLTFFETYKVFKSIEDQNNWFSACDHPLMENYLHPKVIKEKKTGIQYFEGFGLVKGTGRVFVNEVLKDFKEYLTAKKIFQEASFDYMDLEIQKDHVVYKGIKAKNVVFAEGFGLKNNPFFNELPLVGTKGEMLFIKAPKLNLKVQIKSSLFVLPMGDDVYWVGATFNRSDKTLDPTLQGKKELIEKLETIIDVPYKVLEQFGGIRPTVKDRKPLIGKHPKYKNLFIFNGLGTRGVMIAPTAANHLYELMMNNKELPLEIDINRFYKKT